MKIKTHKKLTKLDQIRLDVHSGKSKSSEFEGEFLIRIGMAVGKIQNSSAYKNGELTSYFLSLNPGIEKILYPDIDLLPFYPYAIEYHVKNKSIPQTLSMFELKLYRLVRLYMVRLYPSPLSQSLLSCKHIISCKHMLGPVPEWTGEDTVKLIKSYESNYKEIKKIYKLTGLLNKLRKENHV